MSRDTSARCTLSARKGSKDSIEEGTSDGKIMGNYGRGSSNAFQTAKRVAAAKIRTAKRVLSAKFQCLWSIDERK